MIDFVLDNLRCRAFKSLYLWLKMLIQVLHSYLLKTLCFSDTIQRKAAFLSFIRPCSLKDDGIDHHQIRNAKRYNNDPLSFPDHVCSHADAAITVSSKCILQIFDDLSVRFVSFIGFLPKEQNILYDFPYHFPSASLNSSRLL